MMRSSIAVLIWLAGFAAAAQTARIRKPEYRSVYNLALLCPQQVEWTLRATDLGASSREPSWTFVNDIPDTRAVARHQDYTRTGYDRGHLCPAQDRSAATAAMRSTFAMSNIAPQVPALNRGPWKTTESYCRWLAREHDSVSVVVIPVFLQRDTAFIGSHSLAVPHGFFKAVWSAASDSVLGCWFFFNK